MRKYQIQNENFFSSMQSDEQGYWLGFLVGDGYINKAETRLSLKVSDRDIQALIELKRTLGANHSIKQYAKHTAVLEITSPQLVADLKQYGFTSNKTKTFQIGNLNNRSAINGFVRGILDSDGNVFYRDWKNSKAVDPRIKFLGTQHLLEFVSSHLKKELGIERDPKLYYSDFLYCLNIYKRADIQKLFSLLYA
jgi:hypothetical protein